jgi:hypothetical protein
MLRVEGFQNGGGAYEHLEYQGPDTIGRLVGIASQTPRYGPWFLIKLSLSLTARDLGHWDFGDSSSW